MMLLLLVSPSFAMTDLSSCKAIIPPGSIKLCPGKGMRSHKCSRLPLRSIFSSVRISSYAQYNGGLFILDLNKAPWGCGKKVLLGLKIDI